jgi:hypothetical protein
LTKTPQFPEGEPHRRLEDLVRPIIATGSPSVNKFVCSIHVPKLAQFINAPRLERSKRGVIILPVFLQFNMHLIFGICRYFGE